MDGYRIGFRSSAEKELREIPAPDLQRIVDRIAALVANPRPHGCQKLSREEKFRIRQGDYRIVYSIDGLNKSVLIVKIGHRKEVYR
jgi:mRNA interferase RelE/StbE